jgi:hypothetical protein
MSAIFDRTLIDPTPEDLDALFPEAVAAANAKYRIKTVQFPFPGLGDFLHRFLTTPEGMHGWHGGTKPNYYEGRSQVIILWWSDRLKRKHVRLLGGDGGSLCMNVNLSFGHYHRRTPVSLSPLEHIYPNAVARVRHGDGESSLIAACDCGAVGTPARLGWMGTCCGPCHDRRQEGPPRRHYRCTAITSVGIWPSRPTAGRWRLPATGCACTTCRPARCNGLWSRTKSTGISSVSAPTASS